MSAWRIIAYIGAAILIFFGVLFLWGSGSQQGGGFAWIIVGVISVAIGFGLIWLASRKPAVPADQNVTYKLDLPGNVNLDSLKCKSCGGTLSADDIKMVSGAPVVTCPYCHTVYQLTEEPKW